MKEFKKRVTSVLLAATLVTGTAPGVMAFSADSSSDIYGHWAQSVMEQLAEEGILNGDGAGNYMPDRSMTRAEYSAMLNRIMELTDMSEEISKFTDVSETAWYHDDIAKALLKGYITGTTETTVSPDAEITREQAIVMISRILGLDAENADLSVLDAFGDADEISGWAEGHIAAMVAAGYVAGSDGNILPKKALTRAEGSTLMNSTKEQLKSSQGQSELPEQDVPQAEGVYIDGVYTGTGAGYGGTITIQVTIKDHKISDIKIVSNSETPSFLYSAQTVIDKIMEKQTTDGVDTVSGATLSSNGILTAVKACLSQATGGADTSQTGSTGSSHGGRGNSTKQEGDDYLGSLKDGTYTGSAAGWRGTTTVTVTVAGGKITEINVDSNGDTASYFQRATAVIDKIISSQSTDVDAVSGATYSSYGIINAVIDALKDASASTATTYEVSTWSEFSTAMAKAVDGDIIKLTADINDAGQIDGVSSATMTVNKAVTINGAGHTIKAYNGQSESVTTDKEGNVTATEMVDTTFCFEVTGAQGIVMKKLTIDGASFSQKLGGAMYVETGAELELDNVTFKNCRAANAGAGNGGAAIYVEPHRGDAPTVTARNCTFENNMVNDGTTGRGGAVAVYNANLILEDCTFTGNKAGYGGAVAAAGSSSLTVKGCTFKADNDAAYGGDDIYVFDGYTFYKKTMGTDSTVGFSISGNTYLGTDGTDFKDYRVVMGRVLGEVSDTTNGSSGTVEGTYAGSGNVFTAGHDLTFAASDYDRKGLVEGSPTENTTSYKYVLMNIPYSEFYAAELSGNKENVDAVTSATQNKSKKQSGTYYSVQKNGDTAVADIIEGVSFPVLVDASLIGSFTVADDEEDLKIYESGEKYEYLLKSDVSESTELPACYKIMTANEDGTYSFGKVQGISSEINDATYTFSSSSTWGDYQINFANMTSVTGSDAVYGMVLHTEKESQTAGSDGKETSVTDYIDYGMRALENIWRNAQEIAWSSGIKTTEPHGNTLNAEHYKSIMGRNITGATFYTSSGIYEVSMDEYVTIKLNGSVSVSASADSEAGRVSLESGYARVNISELTDVYGNEVSDYLKSITVSDSEGNDVTGEGGFVYNAESASLTWNKSEIAPGEYTITLSDINEKYASISGEFEVQTSEMPAEYDSENLRIKAADSASESDFSTYINNISSVTVNEKSYSTSGRNSVTVINENGFIDLTSEPFKGMTAGGTYDISIEATGYANDLAFTLTVPDTIYAYASLSYAEYWAAEDIYAAGNGTSSAEMDSNDEADLGAFDAVTRATTNHGLHRGSFQQTAVIYATNDEGTQVTFEVQGWSSDGSTIYCTDGSEISFNRGAITYSVREGRNMVEHTATMTEYEITGIKYVPVAVSTGDYQAFCETYNVTQNGEEMSGGYSENKLQAYSCTALVDGSTNGLKVASKSGDSWSFGARQSGSGSGILGEELASAGTVIAEDNFVQSESKFGDFVRVDFRGSDYGGLGSAMQTVRWDYYGDGNEVLGSYGTKFAADNWMHKSMGMQLGLTESLRCQLPEGTDGTGKWVVTVYALGYEDYSAEVTVTADDIHGKTLPMTDAQREELQELASAANTLLASEAGIAGLAAEAETGTGAWTTLQAHYDEAAALLENQEATYAAAKELLEELPGLIEAVSVESTNVLSESDIPEQTEDNDAITKSGEEQSDENKPDDNKLDEDKSDDVNLDEVLSDDVQPDEAKPDGNQNAVGSGQSGNELNDVDDTASGDTDSSDNNKIDNSIADLKENDITSPDDSADDGSVDAE